MARGMQRAKGDRRRKFVAGKGMIKEDLRPIASRRLTLREMRDAGIWIPVVDEKEKR